MTNPRAGAALVRELSPRIADGELTYRARQPVDVDRARSQHAAYVEVLRASGLDIVHAPVAPAHPDAVFVEDAVVVVGHLAVLARSGAVPRRGEPETLRAVLGDHGLGIAAIAAPGTLDGGDVLQVGHTVYVGRTTRTNDEGIGQLRDIVAPIGRSVVPVEVSGALHLKSAATALTDGRIIADLDGVATSGFPDRDIVPAREPSGADVLLLGDTVVLAYSAPRTADLLDGLGYHVRTVDISELEKLEAGPTCLSVLLPPRIDR